MTSHLLVFQQDKAHNGDVNGVPDAGVVKQSSHLSERVSEGIRPQLGYGIWNPVPTPATQEQAHLTTHKITLRCTLAAHITVDVWALCLPISTPALIPPPPSGDRPPRTKSFQVAS